MKKVLLAILFLISTLTLAEIKDPVIYETKNSVKPFISSLELFSTQSIQDISPVPTMKISDYNTVVATIKFENECMASKFDIVTLDYSTGISKPVQQYLLLLVDQKPDWICGSMPKDLMEQHELYRKFKIVHLPKNITKVTVNGYDVVVNQNANY